MSNTKPSRRRNSKSQTCPTIQLVDINSVFPAEKNDEVYRPIDPNDPELLALAKSIKAEGILSPLHVTEDDVIASGQPKRPAARVSRRGTAGEWGQASSRPGLRRGQTTSGVTQRPAIRGHPGPGCVDSHARNRYPIILVSFGFAFIQAIRTKLPWRVTIPFGINLVANLIFTPIQFGLRNLTLAAADILVVWATILWCMAAIWPHYRWVAVAQVPYFVWVSLATVLQLSITWVNR